MVEISTEKSATVLAKEEAESQLLTAVKKLVDQPHSIGSLVPLSQVKDVFNAISERLNDWRKDEQPDQARFKVDPSDSDISLFQNESPRHVLLLNILISMISNNQEKVNETQLLSDIIKESEDLRAIALATKLRIALTTSFLKSQYQVERVIKLSTAPNNLRSPQNHSTLLQLYSMTRNGEKLDLKFEFEVENQPTSLSERVTKETILVPDEKILSSVPSAQLAKDLIKDMGIALSTNGLQELLEAKIIWYRFARTHSQSVSMKALLACIGVGCAYAKENTDIEAFSYIKGPQEKFFEEAIELMIHCKEPSIAESISNTLYSLTKSRNEELSMRNPLIRIPVAPLESITAEFDDRSFLNKVLAEICAIKIEHDGSKFVKQIIPKVLQIEVLSNSSFQHKFLMLCRSVISNTLRHQMNANEGTGLLQSIMKVVDDYPKSHSVQLLLVQDDSMINTDNAQVSETKQGYYSFNMVFQLEALQTLLALSKPRFEEQFQIIKRIEARLEFEVDNLQATFFQMEDTESLLTEQTHKDRSSIIRTLVNVLIDLVQRDREGLGMSRRIIESSIPSQILRLAQFNNNEQAELIETFINYYITLIGRMCHDTPGQTPGLIRNGVIPSIYTMMKERLPETSDCIQLALFFISSTTIQEDGKKLAEEMDVFRDVMKLYRSNMKFHEQHIGVTSNQNISKYLFTLFDRSPIYMTQAAQITTDLIQQAEEFANSIITRYQEQIDLIGKEDVDNKVVQQINSELQNYQSFKELKSVVNILVHFAGYEERGYDRHERNGNSRHVNEIFPLATFTKLLQVFEQMTLSPCLAGFHKQLLLILRQIVEVGSFPANIPHFIEMMERCATNLNKEVGGQLHKLDRFEFPCEQKSDIEPPKEEVKQAEPAHEEKSAFEDEAPMEVQAEKLENVEMINTGAAEAQGYIKSVSKRNRQIQMLSSLLFISRAIFSLHSQTQITIMQNPVFQQFIQTVRHVDKILTQMNSKNFVQSIQEEGQIYKVTQKEYLDDVIGEKFDEAISQFQQNQSNIQYLLFIGNDTRVLTDITIKFIDVSYQVARQANNEQREKQQANQLFIGKLAYKISKAFSKLTAKNVDGSIESLEHLQNLASILSNLYIFSQHGMLSGACFYQFFKLGGLHNLINLFKWLATQLKAYDKDDIKRVNLHLLERCINEISRILQRYILIYEKESGLDGNFLEVWQQSVFVLKMSGPFDNPKKFYQNVSFTLLSEVFSGLDQPQPHNCLRYLVKKNAPNQLLDFALLLLNQSSKDFQNCHCLKIGNGGPAGRHAEREERRRPGQGGADPDSIQLLMDMFPGLTQQRAALSLQQARGNVENACEIVMQYQALGQLGIDADEFDGGQMLNADRVDIDSDDDDIALAISFANLDGIAQPKKNKPSRVTQVEESQFQKVKKTLAQHSFNWIMDIHEELDKLKVQKLILDALRSDIRDEAQMKTMYEKVSPLIKKSFKSLKETLSPLNILLPERGLGLDSEHLERVSTIENLLIDSSAFTRIVQRLLIHNKYYLKEALFSIDVMNESLEIVDQIIEIYKNSAFEFTLTHLDKQIQKVLYDLLLLIISTVQMVHLKVVYYQGQKIKRNDPSKHAQFNEGIKKYRSKVPAKRVFQTSVTLAELASKSKLKSQIITICVALSLRVIIDRESLEQRTEAIARLFEIFPEISSQNKGVKFDPKIVQSVAVLSFESDEIIKHQIDTYLQRVFFAKYEYEAALKEGGPDLGAEWSKISLKNFNAFFNSLSCKDPELFKMSLKDSHEIRTVKKNGQNSIDDATIKLKEANFDEVKALITKDRGQFKKLTKILDFKNDKSLNQQIKASKKALLAIIPESSKQNLQQLIKAIRDAQAQWSDDISNFITTKSNLQQYKRTNEEIKRLEGFGKGANELDTLSSMLMAYPAYCACLVQPKQSQVSQLNFVQWYVKEYLLTRQFQRNVSESQDDQNTSIVEYNVVVKDSDISYSQISAQLNKITGYHHLMSFNEQLVKHQLRTKFIFEALNGLSKILKDKASINPLKQRATIKSCLIVIESLITPNQHLPYIAGDNYINSLRACFVRDASNKDLNSQYPGFLKIVDELLSDVIDASEPQNTDIVNKCVNILKTVAEFINKEKKKEDAKANPSPKGRLSIVQEAALSSSPRLDPLNEEAKQQERIPSFQQELSEEEEMPENPIQLGGDALVVEAQEEDEEMIEEANDQLDEDEEDPDEDEELDDPLIDHLHSGDENEQLDDYGEDEDESAELDDQPNAVVVMHRRNGQQNDIINFGHRQAAEPVPHHWRFGRHGIERQAINNNNEWTEEEAQVQRILGNFSGNQPDQPAQPPHRHYYGGLLNHHLGFEDFEVPPFPGFRGHRDVPPQNVPGQQDMQKGLIERIFEEFKIINERELYDIVIQQRQHFEIQNIKKGKAVRNLDASLPRPQHINHRLLGEDPIDRLNALLGRVDEVDEHHWIEQLDQLRMNRLGGPPGVHHFAFPERDIFIRQPGQIHMNVDAQQLDLNAYDNGTYNQQLRQAYNQGFQTQYQTFSQQLLATLDIRVEEEEKEEQEASQAQNNPQRARPWEEEEALGGIVDPLLSAFMYSLPRGIPPPADLQDLPVPPVIGDPFGAIFANLLQQPAHPAPQALQIEEQQIQPLVEGNNTEIEQLRQQIQERSNQLQQTINNDVQSIQNIVQRNNSAALQASNSGALIPIVEEPEEPLAIEGIANAPQAIGQFAQFGVHQPASFPIQQPNVSLDDVSGFEPEESHREFVADEHPSSTQVQEVAQQIDNMHMPEEEKKAEEQPEAPADQTERTFGYPNAYLIENGIDPEILAELPEDLRAELLSQIDIPADFIPPGSNPNPAQQQQQPLAQSEQANPAQPHPVPAQPEQPEYYAIAQALGLDPEFLANLPEDMRNELIQQAQQQQAPPRRQPEQMDTASFVATVTDPTLRREIFMNMDEATIASLPPALMAEARNVHNYIRQDRERRQREFAERERQQILGGMRNDYDGRRMMRDEFAGRRPAEVPNRREKTLEEIVNIRNNQIAEDHSAGDIIQTLSHQLVSNEKILEVLLLILLINEKAECDLIPCLLAMTKLQNQGGVPVIRNKVVNAMTFLLKAISNNDSESLKMFIPSQDIQKKKTVLLLIGTLRLLLRANKSMMKFILKGLVQREDQGSAKGGFSSQILKKQFKALILKNVTGSIDPMPSSDTFKSEMIDTTTVAKPKAFTPPSALAEIFSLIKSCYFKGDKMLLRNLSLLIQQILKQFDLAFEELELSNQMISSETLLSIADVLTLERIEQNLLEALADFFYKLSLKKPENFKLISEFCGGKSVCLLRKLNERMFQISVAFQESSIRLGKQLNMIDQRNFSHNSALEEEKSELIIDTALGQSRSSKPAPTFKLIEDDEKQLKQMLRVSEDSDILFRIFKLLNQFFDNVHKLSEEKIQQAEENKHQMLEIAQFVRRTYEDKALTEFVSNVSEVLRIVFRTNMEISDSVSNLTFCVFSAFYPELVDAIDHQDRIDKEEKMEPRERSSENKYQIKMLPLTEDSVRNTKEKFTLFKNSTYMTNRVLELSQFCMVNKRLINRMIKQRAHLFANELEGMIKHMPNILDFENKRNYFKKELNKLKRGGFQGIIQMFINRNNIFQDTFGQLKDKQAEELKGRLHINFTGERGQDAGGLTRDFYIELSREMFNPNYSLFIASSSGATYQPNPKSFIEAQHLKYFKFVGRIIGKAIFDECLLECYFVKSMYKIMIGEPLSIADLEDFDNEYYNNLKWCLANDVACLETSMVLEQDNFGRMEEIELVPNGKNIPLTNQNKWDYVEKVSRFRLYGSIQNQIDAFLEGFYELIPKELVSIFNFKELELLISGLPNFDLEDLKANTEYSGYSSNSPQVLWLWEVLEVLDNSERAEFLQFVTGSSKVPVEGFKGLIGMRGPQKFSIAKIKSDDIMRLPSGHTCFNQLDLPEYPSKEILHERLLIAIKETKGFGFA